MKLEHVFKKTKQMTRHLTTRSGQRPEVPEGLLRKCNMCKAAIFAEDVKAQAYICPKCGGYFRMPAYKRIERLTDAGTFVEWDQEVQGGNPLQYKGYEEKVKLQQEKTGLREAVVTGTACIDGSEVVLGVCDGRFMMASMGEAVGEKITRAVERATERRLPLILFACSGGARMQEGIVSLMQMAKTSAALKRHSDAGLLYISVLTDPTTGGVTASFAMLGDIILAEPGALIGFAGPRVIEQTIGQTLPNGFQRAEYLLQHGMIDAIVKRTQIKEELSKILKMHEEQKGKTVEDYANKLPNCGKQSSNHQNAWECVQISRRKDRPVARDYIEKLFTEFTEFHGDRTYADDPALIGGIARFHGIPVTVIAQAKGRNTGENIQQNFGMPLPEGYRKALRLMKQAEKFHRPIICLVDTPGAFCGIEAEERGQGEAIAKNLWEMSTLQVPIFSMILGEGGSGGALALAAADEVWMMEHSIYSILSPEGFASILWKDSTKAKEAAEVMRLTAEDLFELGVIEGIFPEPSHLTVENLEWSLKYVDAKIGQFLKEYSSMTPEQLTTRRYERFRRM